MNCCTELLWCPPRYGFGLIVPLTQFSFHLPPYSSWNGLPWFASLTCTGHVFISLANILQRIEMDCITDLLWFSPQWVQVRCITDLVLISLANRFPLQRMDVVLQHWIRISLGGGFGLRRFGMGVRAGASNETTNPYVDFRVILLPDIFRHRRRSGLPALNNSMQVAILDWQGGALDLRQ